MTRISCFYLLYISLLLASCNGKATGSQRQEYVHQDTSARVTPDTTPAASPVPDMPEHMLRYATYINDSSIIDDAYSYTMVYIDKDTIPEMVIDTGGNAGGYIVLSLQDGNVLSYTTTRLALTYIEKSGLMCNESGVQEEYFETIIKLTKTGYGKIAYWEYSYSRDEQRRIIRSVLDGKPVKAVHAERCLKQLYNKQKAIDVDSIKVWKALSDLRNVKI